MLVVCCWTWCDERVHIVGGSWLVARASELLSVYVHEEAVGSMLFGVHVWIRVCFHSRINAQ